MPESLRRVQELTGRSVEFEEMDILDQAALQHLFKKVCTGAGEMAQRVRALTALLKVLSSNLSHHMVAHNALFWCI
jgi:hypothetical protein